MKELKYSEGTRVVIKSKEEIDAILRERTINGGWNDDMYTYCDKQATIFRIIKHYNGSMYYRLIFDGEACENEWVWSDDMLKEDSIDLEPDSEFIDLLYV